MTFPDRPGVYIFRDQNDKPIYIGKAKSLKNRIRSYFQTPSSSPKTDGIINRYRTISYILTPTELEALLLERKLIKKYDPYFNVMWKDDKQYPYIKVTVGEQWPRMVLARKKENDDARYFGPYEGASVRETLRLLSRLFPIRQCKSSPLKPRRQPCLQFYIKRCFGPCSREVPRAEYLGMVDAILNILEGDIVSAIRTLEAEMEAASQKKEFEAAAILRDRIKSLKRMLQKKPGWMPKAKEQIGDSSVLELRNALSLGKSPNRIEAFDISNISNTSMTASMVSFEGGEPKKSDYRRFKIQSFSDKPNDAAAIHEVVLRRYTGSQKDKLPAPQLVLIDGGIAQVRAAKKALVEAGLKDLPVIGLAKREEEIFFPEKNIPLKLERSSGALKLLQQIRDEAHRFAVKYHRHRRSRFIMLKSKKP